MDNRRSAILYRADFSDDTGGAELAAAETAFGVDLVRSRVDLQNRLVVSRYSCLPFYKELAADLFKRPRNWMPTEDKSQAEELVERVKNETENHYLKALEQERTRTGAEKIEKEIAQQNALRWAKAENEQRARANKNDEVVRELSQDRDTIMADRDSVGYQLKAANEQIAALKEACERHRLELKESYFKCAVNNLKAAESALKDGMLL